MIFIGDVHGCYDTLISLIEQFPKDQELCFVGDLIDRGLSSRQVVKFVKDNNHLCVLGNHEQFMIESYKTYDDIWMVNGGDKTLDSYRIHKNMLEDHVEWMKNLPLYLEFKDLKLENGDYILVSYSSAKKVWHWSKERKKTHHKLFKEHLVWSRNYNPMKIPGIYNIFGHTPNQTPRINSVYANIDTGCCYNRDGYHYLTALQVPEMKVYQQINVEQGVLNENQRNNTTDQERFHSNL